MVAKKVKIGVVLAIAKALLALSWITSEGRPDHTLVGHTFMAIARFDHSLHFVVWPHTSSFAAVARRIQYVEHTQRLQHV